MVQQPPRSLLGSGGHLGAAGIDGGVNVAVGWGLFAQQAGQGQGQGVIINDGLDRIGIGLGRNA